MLIKDGSPFFRVPAVLNRRQLLSFDGIRYCIEMIEIAYSAICEALMGISLSYANGQEIPKRAFPFVFMNAWSIIDSANRLVVLLEQLPNLKRTPAIKIFIGNMLGVRDLRNGIQHLDGTIREIADQNHPAWGYLSWVCVPDPMNKRAILGFVVSGTTINTEPSFKFPDRFPVPIGLIRLNAYGNSVVLSDVMQSVARFAVGFENTLEKSFADLNGQHGELPTAGSDIIMLADLEIGGDMSVSDPAEAGEGATAPEIQKEKEDVP